METLCLNIISKIDISTNAAILHINPLSIKYGIFSLK